MINYFRKKKEGRLLRKLEAKTRKKKAQDDVKQYLRDTYKVLDRSSFTGAQRINKICDEYLESYSKSLSEEVLLSKQREQAQILYNFDTGAPVDFKGFEHYKLTNSLYSPDSGLGTSSDPLQNIFGVTEFANHTLAARTYQALPVMSKVIMSPIDLALKKPIDIEFIDLPEAKAEDLKTIIYDKLEEFDWRAKLRTFLYCVSLSSYGAILLPVYRSMSRGDGEEPSYQKLLGDEILGVNVVPDYAFFYIHYSHISQVWQEGFGEPTDFVVGGRRTDPRLFYWAVNNFDPALGRGISILANNTDSIRALTLSSVATSHLILDLHRKFIYIDNPEVYANHHTEDIANILSLVKKDANNSDCVSLPPGYKIHYQNAGLGSGMGEVFNHQWNFIAGTSAYPADHFKGSSLGQIASAEKNERQLNSMIKSTLQTRHIVPVTKFIIQKILESMGYTDLQFKLTPQPLYEESEREKLELEKLKAEIEQMKTDVNIFGQTPVENPEDDRNPGKLDV